MLYGFCSIAICGVVIEKELREVFVTFQSHFEPSHLKSFASATYAVALSFRVIRSRAGNRSGGAT
jgi:hypothetical protein